MRLSRLQESSLAARRLSQSHLVLVASPAHIAEHGTSTTPSEAANHQALVHATVTVGEQWRFRSGDGWERVRVVPRFRTDNGAMLRAAAIAGLGLTILPSFLAADAVRRGELAVLLPDHPLDAFGIWAVMPEGRSALARIRTLVDFLVERFSGERA